MQDNKMRKFATISSLVFYLTFLSISETRKVDNGYQSKNELDFDALYEFYDSNLPHRREKRFLWMTHEKRMVLPPGTQLVLTPTLAMPLLRYPPHGIDANLTISTPFTSE